MEWRQRVTQEESDVIASLRAATSAEDLRERSIKAASSLGVSHMVSVRVGESSNGGPRVTSVVETVPIDVTVATLKARFPNYEAMCRETLTNRREPFDSNGLPLLEKFSDVMRDVWALRRDVMNCSYFLTVPVHDDKSMIGAVTYFAEDQIDTQLALRTLTFAGYAQMQTLGIIAPENNPLTARQRDVLSYCAHGKSDWEIGELLGISNATVHEHIEAAKKRLDVRTRVQAVVIAVKRGWISV